MLKYGLNKVNVHVIWYSIQIRISILPQYFSVVGLYQTSTLPFLHRLWLSSCAKASPFHRAMFALRLTGSENKIFPNSNYKRKLWTSPTILWNYPEWEEKQLRNLIVINNLLALLLFLWNDLSMSLIESFELFLKMSFRVISVALTRNRRQLNKNKTFKLYRRLTDIFLYRKN